MDKLTRIFQKQFGSLASTGGLGIFGSLANGNPQTTTDPAQIQSLDKFLEGWESAVVGDRSPTLQDLNGLFYFIFYQLGYILQQGVAEWNVLTMYHPGQWVNYQSELWQCLNPEVIGTAPNLDTYNWQRKTGGASVTENEIAPAAVTKTRLSAANYYLSPSTSNYSVAGTGSYATVTNAEGSITVSEGGRPVLVCLQADGSSNACKLSVSATSVYNMSGFLRLKRGSTVIAVSEISLNDNNTLNHATGIPTNLFTFIDFPTAGTHAYTLEQMSASGCTVAVSYAKFLLMEL
jgi:hypothetical protein